MKNSELTGIIKEFITPRLIEVKDLFFKSQSEIETIKTQTISNSTELKDIRSAIEKSNANSEKNAKEISELKTILSKVSDQLNDVKEVTANASGVDQVVEELSKCCESTRSDLQKMSKKLDDCFTKTNNDVNGLKKTAELNTLGINKNSTSIDKLLEDFGKLAKTFESLDTDNKINDTVRSIETVASSLNKTMESNNFELSKITNKIVNNITEDKQVLNNNVKQLTNLGNNVKELTNLGNLIDESFAKFADVLDKNRNKLQTYVGDEIGKVSVTLKNTTEERSIELQKVTNRIASCVSDDNRLLNNIAKQITTLMDTIGANRNKLQAFMNSGFGGVSISLQKAVSGIDKELLAFKGQLESFKELEIERKLGGAVEGLESIASNLGKTVKGQLESFKGLEIEKKLGGAVEGLENITSNLGKTIDRNNHELRKVTNKVAGNITEDKQVLNNTVKQLKHMSGSIEKNREELKHYFENIFGQILSGALHNLKKNKD